MRSKSVSGAGATLVGATRFGATRFGATLFSAALVVAAGSAACSERPEPLEVEGRTITVFNDSGEAWNGVEIWLNDHYRVTRPTIAPGEKFAVQLESFVAGFGQRFPSNQMVNGIEVTATDASGDAVKLVRGTGRRR